MIEELGWYWKRLQAMSLQEIGYRVQDEGKKKYWKFCNKLGIKWNIPSPNLKIKDKSSFSFPDDFEIRDRDKKAIVDEANSYLNNEWFFFNTLHVREEDEIDWHYDPVNNKKAPTQYTFDINHKNEKEVGSIKIIWEKNRHHHLTVLALAFYLTKEERYVKVMAYQLLDWIDKNPFLMGVNWSHPLEHAIRLISWVWCERLLRESAHYQKVFGKGSPVWESVYLHQKSIYKLYSKGSSANNHLIGEMAGLYVAASAWPFFQESIKWGTFAKSKLEKEIIRQTYSSGINKELAFSYQIFVIEFFLLAALESEYMDESFSAEYKTILKKMIEVIPLLTDKGGNLPRYGDGDEGMAIQLQPISYRRDHWIYEVGRDLLNTNVPTPEIQTLPAVIFSKALNEKKDYNLPKKSVGFKDAGIYILSENRGKIDEVFVMADAGPLGYLSISAHGHADALSFTMSFGGIPIIIDPGTYCYHTREKWRYYFRGTSAHNTITIDGEDQSVQAGSFLWSEKAKTNLKKWVPQNNRLIASHDGYQRMGVKHEREFYLRNNSLIVNDKLEGSSLHAIENSLHFAPHCKVQLNEHFCFVRSENVKLKIEVDSQLNSALRQGDEKGGWYSPGFAVKEPTYSLVMKGNFQLPKIVTTKINIEKL